MGLLKKRFYVLLVLGLLQSKIGITQVYNIRAHDPSIIKTDSIYYIFATGPGIFFWSSTDRQHWQFRGKIFNRTPDWVYHIVPDFGGDMWAPDISYYRGKYYLFYAVSKFERNTSAIGLATNVTLNPEDKNYYWDDHGIIVQSIPGRDMWNAIDPNLAVDRQGIPWLVFGSFWDGIKLVKLDTSRTRLAKPEEWYTLASRYRTYGIADTLPGDGAIEAPYIIYRNGYYYLFVSFDYCCRGVKSNYKVAVGRAKNIIGPYIDKSGKLMTDGGGTVIVEGNENFPGLGHNSILHDQGKDYIVTHAYDAKKNGLPQLVILPIKWENDWPIVNTDLLK
ncbi:MAG: family 43 glycosylhydrolase [Thermoflavifilum sp.]|nr:family 43 glycosylhydrolase [Thermoflavifilum sp.]